MRICITGGSGTLGTALKACPLLSADAVLAPSHREMDITDAAAVRRWMLDARPDLVIHAAALIRSRGGSDPEQAFLASRTNVYGTGAVAEAARAVNARLLYVSTDFVFDGSKPGGMYTEDDIPSPLGTYALTKYAGEQLARAHTSALIVRTSFVDEKKGWPYPAAFVDRFTSKMHVSDLARELVLAARSSLRGILHIGGKRRSYYDIAAEITPAVKATTMTDAQAIADPMPVDTSLDSSRWQQYCASPRTRELHTVSPH